MSYVESAIKLLDKLPVNAFDISVVAFLVVGVLCGRRHGMSEELLSLLKWLAVVVVCSWCYEFVGRGVASLCGTCLFVSNMLGYSIVATAVLLAFGLIGRSLGGKLVGSDVFGHTEYYLGMTSGMVRFGCIMMVGLALLNARYYSPGEIRATERFEQDQIGMTIPSWYTVQGMVFQRSLTGPLIKRYLGNLLIKSTTSNAKPYRQKDAIDYLNP